MSLDLFSSILESLSDPQQKHAMMVHLPIAISLIGVLGLLVLACTAGRSSVLRWCCVGIYLLGTGTAYLASEAGEHAEHTLDTTTMTQPALEDLEKHEEMGEHVYRYFLGTAVLTALVGIDSDKRFLRPTLLILALLASLATAVRVGEIGHYGGKLVYDYGVGVPATPNNFKDAAPTSHDHSDD